MSPIITFERIQSSPFFLLHSFVSLVCIASGHAASGHAASGHAMVKIKSTTFTPAKLIMPKITTKNLLLTNQT